ncbi:recombinase family protein [Streptomyces sp. NPDC046866]|uniref:recombinase family protein n=1 Tax=Streptomyces sp. NPDC046866 TaxID=3154921 RepID=UPI00345520C1
MTDRLYLRHSTDKQTNARQLHALDSLLKSGAPKYEDPATSSRVYAINRTGFRRLLDDAAVGDTIRIADAARLFRSTKDVIQIREVLQRRGLHPAQDRDQSQRYILYRNYSHPDSLVDLFIRLVVKINTRAERKVNKELGAELKKVRGKEAMLLRVAEAALSEPSGIVRRVIFPVVGGEKTLKALAAEAAANEARYKARVRTVLRSSSAHWRRMLAPLLGAVESFADRRPTRPMNPWNPGVRGGGNPISSDGDC